MAEIDWSAARITTFAKNRKPEDRFRVIEVTREAVAKSGWPDTWADAEARVALGEAEPVLTSRGEWIPPKDVAWLREATAKDRNLRGGALLYAQGWDLASAE